MATTQSQHPTPPGPQAPQSPGPPPHGSNDINKKAKQRGSLLKIALVLLAVVAALLLIGLVPRLLHGPKLKSTARASKNSTPTVSTVTAKKPAAFDSLNLPGNIQAVQQTAITARASGYVRQRFVDIGDHVRAGQTLALLATPDLDQQVAQARAQLAGSQAAQAQAQANVSTQRANAVQTTAELARAQAMLAQARTQHSQAQAALAQAQETSEQQAAQLAQAEANLNLARVTAQRYQNLLADGAVDQQSADQNTANYQSSFANMRALQSAVRAGRANTQAFRDAVQSSSDNITAYQQGVVAGRAQVAAAQANVRSFEANVAASAANVGANRANLARSVALQGFGRVTAPFDGVITARNIDTGALITAGGGSSGGDSASVGSGNAGATAQGNAAGGSASGTGAAASSTSSGSAGGAPSSLFSIAQTNNLHIYLNVPQTYADVVRPGQTAQIVMREVPNHPFVGRIVRTAAALDTATRTLVSEVRLPNAGGGLKPGMFAQVHLRVPHASGDLVVPDAALITNAGGTQVLLVGKRNTLHFQPITVGRDFGTTIEVLSGLKAGQAIVANPSDTLHEGEKVHAIAAAPAPQGG